MEQIKIVKKIETEEKQIQIINALKKSIIHTLYPITNHCDYMIISVIHYSVK